ncbi:MAG: hypothetical protein IJW37_05285 [Lachnospiraceae bacterium]|nr:hypothetical protein [Lachnospiraceae bacterium]
MKRIFWGIMSLILLTFVACKAKEMPQNTGVYGGTDGLDLFLSEIQPVKEPWTNEERAEHASYLQPETYEHIFTKEEVEEFLKPRDIPEKLSTKQAAEDVNQVFQLLAYGYGGYTYFGGDEIFLPLRDNILNELETVDEISTYDLWKLLWESLSPVIVDRHFSITTDDANTFVANREYSQYTYFVRNLYFDDPTGIDSQYVKHTIGPDGAITYCLATVCSDMETLPKSMTIKGVEHTLTWSYAEPIQRETENIENIFSETTAGHGQLPVLANHSLAGDDNRLQKFASTAYTYRKEPLMVFDLRGNTGGVDNYANRWMKNFCGKDILPKVLFSKKYSNIYTVISGENNNKEQDTWKTTIDSAGTVWETDTLMFVLLDGNVASPGEYFTHMLSLGKRVILVGSNTMGCLTFGNVPTLYLPNSGIAIRLGTSIAFYDAIENRDGVGYSPDLWVEPKDSLNAVVRLCKYYELIESKVSIWDLISN